MCSTLKAYASLSLIPSTFVGIADKICDNTITNATLNGRNVLGGLVFDTNFATGKF